MSPHEIAAAIERLRCRHPEGIICSHRQYDHDQRMQGYSFGFVSGQENMAAKWRGNVTGEGPYANYPVPASPPPTLSAGFMRGWRIAGLIGPVVAFVLGWAVGGSFVR